MARRILALVLVLALVAAGCARQRDATPPGLSDDERAFADLLAAEWAAATDFGVDEESSQCLGEGLVVDFGVDRLTEIGYGANGAAGSEVRFELLTEDEVETLGARILDCVDIGAALVDGMVEEGLDEASATCIAEALDETDFFVDLLMAGYEIGFDESRAEEMIGPAMLQFLAVVFSAMAECLSPEDFRTMVDAGLDLPIGQVGSLPEPPPQPEPPPAQVPKSREMLLWDLSLGDCFDEPVYVADDWSVVIVPVIKCDDPHDFEVYFVFDLADGPYPGDDETWDLADEGCFAEFEPFVGAGYWDSDLDFIPVRPLQAEWEAGQRTVLCVLFAVDESKLIGSMRGVGPNKNAGGENT